MARPKGAKRAGDARGRPPPSYILLHRRPGSLPSAPEKFTKMSRCRPRPARNGGKVGRRREAAGLTLGRGAPAGRAGGCRRRQGGRGPLRSAGSSPEPRLQAARRGRGVGRRESAAGVGRRLEAGAGGGKGGGAGGETQGGWEVRLAEGWADRSLPAPPASALAPLLRFPPGLRSAAGQRGPASGVFGTKGRMLAEVEGSVRCTRGAGTRRWRVRGRRGGTSLLRTAGLGPSPRV